MAAASGSKAGENSAKSMWRRHRNENKTMWRGAGENSKGIENISESLQEAEEEEEEEVRRRGGDSDSCNNNGGMGKLAAKTQKKRWQKASVSAWQRRGVAYIKTPA
jgi:hypothetical protein